MKQGPKSCSVKENSTFGSIPRPLRTTGMEGPFRICVGCSDVESNARQFCACKKILNLELTLRTSSQPLRATFEGGEKMSSHLILS